MKQYFEYVVITKCGIPKVRLMGTQKDWENLIEKTKKLEKFELKFWIPNVIWVLEKFLAAYKGEEDKQFWNMCYKLHHGNGHSGAKTTIEGWVNNFFPYDSTSESE